MKGFFNSIRIFFIKVGIFFKSAAQRVRKETPAFWKYVRWIGGFIAGVSFTLNNIGLKGRYAELLFPYLDDGQTAGSVLFVIAWFAVKKEPTIDQKLEGPFNQLK